MKGALDVILADPHEAGIRPLLMQGAGAERSAYMLFGQAEIENGPLVRCGAHEIDLSFLYWP